MIHRNLQVSLQRFCADFGTAQGLTFVNFDSSWDESELPRAAVVGPLGLSYEMEEHLVEGSVQIGVSTWDDTNLFTLAAKIDALAELLKPNNKLKIYDADTGVQLGLMIIQSGTKVMPVAGTKNRPLQFIGISFLTTVTYKLDGVVT